MVEMDDHKNGSCWQPLFLQPLQQEVKIHQASIRLPPRQRVPHPFVVQRLPTAQPLLEATAGSHIIPREDV